MVLYKLEDKLPSERTWVKGEVSAYAQDGLTESLPGVFLSLAFFP